ncbi:protocadherin gamma-A11-like [Engraulis encrasicolus]|uniref:protocadherin gamma-A11-like n=1 Tax=Engraulis encrasicolus TaxID=184585 RepID=UPI002FD4B09F
MGDDRQRNGPGFPWIAAQLFLLLCFGETVWAQLRYSVPEEGKVGSVVGNVAKDLGLDVGTLVERGFRIVSGTKDALFQVNQNNGVLIVHKNIDREELCEGNAACLINLKIAVENPLEIHYVTVEIMDVNDNAPRFLKKEDHLEVAENTLPGADFPLVAARDSDSGANSLRLYKLSHSDHFELEVRDDGEDNKLPVLKLKNLLDRERKSVHRLVLTAVDGGNPPKSSSINITISVQDVNDNRPVFSQNSYTASVKENTATNTFVLKVNASDADAGVNGQVTYYFANNLKQNVYDTFEVDEVTGEIRVKGIIDFESTEVYRADVTASDKGQPAMSTNCRVIIKVIDVNDNKPEIEVTSLSNVVSEGSKAGTVISLISITDKDSGDNGKVTCSLSEYVPFELKPSFQDNMYSLVVKRPLDRELVPDYDITIVATDLGQPPLSTSKTFNVQISDVNDNSPEFSQNPLELYLMENNTPGDAIFSVSASDKDTNDNALIAYHLIRNEGVPQDVISFLNINSENGVIHALKSFDFESVKMFQFQVLAKDSGNPPLSSNVTVKVYIQDQNDNAPKILYPVSSNGSAEGVEEIPRNVNGGYLVTKVRAYDADIGYNGWLLFSLQEVTDHTLFSLDRYTGQIRTLRAFTETDEAQHKLVILVKDNGNISLSATATLTVSLVEPKEAFAASDVRSAVSNDEDSNATFYLFIALGSVSCLFLVSIIVLIAMRCAKPTDFSSKYLQDTNYDGTLCHSIQYRSGDKRYMLVGPRMSIGSTIVPGSNANTLVVPDRRSRASGEVSVTEL